MQLPNEQQQKNLRTLAEYLLSRDLKMGFHMGTFYEPYPEAYCGTIGCAVGHGPYAGIPKDEEEEWGDYADRAFGSVEAKIFRHLFSGNWKYYDNTPEGAAKRILNFLDQIEKGTLTEEYLEENTPFEIMLQKKWELYT
jgi:hypothetical protein